MVDSLGCDKHNRAQGALGRQEETTHSPSLWPLLAQGVWTVPIVISYGFHFVKLVEEVPQIFLKLTHEVNKREN